QRGHLLDRGCRGDRGGLPPTDPQPRRCRRTGGDRCQRGRTPPHRRGHKRLSDPRGGHPELTSCAPPSGQKPRMAKWRGPLHSRPAGKGWARATDGLQEEGEVRLGALLPPAGRRVVPMDGPGEPVAWVTAEPVPDAGLAWSALSDLQQQTGLVPILLTDSEKD